MLTRTHHVIVVLEQSDSCNAPGEDVCTYSNSQNSVVLPVSEPLIKDFDEDDPDRGGETE